MVQVGCVRVMCLSKGNMVKCQPEWPLVKWVLICGILCHCSDEQELLLLWEHNSLSFCWPQTVWHWWTQQAQHIIVETYNLLWHWLRIYVRLCVHICLSVCIHIYHGVHMYCFHSLSMCLSAVNSIYSLYKTDTWQLPALSPTKFLQGTALWYFYCLRTFILSATGAGQNNSNTLV